MGKRKRERSDDEILRKLRKLQKEIKRRRRRHSSSSESRSDPESAYEVEQVRGAILEPEISQEGEVEVEGKAPSDQVLQDSSLEGGFQNESEVAEVVPLDEEILVLLGEPPKEDSPVGKETHNDIASRLENILVNGLKKDIKDKITEEYPIPGNCQLFKAPLLNAEIKAAISDMLQKKDASIAARQGQIGIALTALTQAMDILILDKTNQLALKHVSNACRLLCDSHYIDTKMRRNFLISTLNNRLKDTLKESKRDKNLFGESLPEKLKATKAITKTSQDLRPFKPRSYITKNTPSTSAANNNNNLNWKRPQSNVQTAHRKATTTTHRTAGSSSTAHRMESTHRPKMASGRATRTTAYYRNQKRS